MTVHLFGASSSPGGANYGSKRLRTITKTTLDLKRPTSLDGLMSVDTPQRAVSLTKQRKGLCARGGLRLHKFVSNSKDVISAIPPEDHSSPLKNLNLGHDRLPIERALDVQWCLETDTFQQRITVQDTPLTRRSILSTVSSVYDPLGSGKENSSCSMT